MTSVLYKTDQSPPARTVLMMIDILGIKVDLKDLNPVLREQDQPEFFKKNPMRTVPILDEGDYNLADSHAIIIYLLDKYGKPEHFHLYPMDKRKRATINQRLFFDCGVLFPRLRAIMAPTYLGRLTEITKNMKINVEDAYTTLEEYLNQSKYVADKELTIADISIYNTTYALDGLHPVDEKRFPKLKQWLGIMYEQDFVKKVNIPYADMHIEILKMLMDNNRRVQKSKL